MSIQTAYSQKTTASEAVKDIRSSFGEVDPKLIIFFVSSSYNPDDIAKEVQSHFQSSVAVGCTTSGEIVTGKMLKESIVAMALDADIISDLNVQIVENISGDFSLESSMKGFSDYFNQPIRNMNIDEYVGIILADGMSGAEERLMDSLGNFTDVIFIGGSAGDDLKFNETFIFYEGKAYKDAALLTMLKPGVEFSFIKTQSFQSLGKVLEASKVNEAAREVIEFNNKPAADAYAEALGVSVEKINDYFFENPVAIVSENDMFIRSPRALNDDKSISFYCNMKEGSNVTLVENTNIIQDTQDALDAKNKEMGGIQGLLNFNCILRTLELESKNLVGKYEMIFSTIPTVGFSTYGESFIGHINQTATILAFGNKK